MNNTIYIERESERERNVQYPMCYIRIESSLTPSTTASSSIVGSRATGTPPGDFRCSLKPALVHTTLSWSFNQPFRIDKRRAPQSGRHGLEVILLDGKSLGPSPEDTP